MHILFVKADIWFFDQAGTGQDLLLLAVIQYAALCKQGCPNRQCCLCGALLYSKESDKGIKLGLHVW